MQWGSLTALTAVLLAGVWAAADEKKEKGKDKAPSLAGEYVIVSGERAGRKEPPERIKGTLVRFTDSAVAVFDMSKRQTYGASYKLDMGKKPWTITMTAATGRNKGEVARGLIEKQGDTVRLIYALPGGELPTGFATKDKQLMFTMKTLKE